MEYGAHRYRAQPSTGLDNAAALSVGQRVDGPRREHGEMRKLTAAHRNRYTIAVLGGLQRGHGQRNCVITVIESRNCYHGGFVSVHLGNVLDRTEPMVLL